MKNEHRISEGAIHEQAAAQGSLSQPIIAEVLVEVPARNLDQTFDYLISDALAEKVVCGARVIVPLGPRKVQGYVLNVKHRASGEYRLKSIEKVLDQHPPLTEELIELGRWMSAKYVCILIKALQAMVPAVLKSKTYKTVQTEADGRQKVTYHVQDRVTKKKITVVEPDCHRQALSDEINRLPANARKQKQILEHFLQHPDPVPLADLLKATQTTRNTVQALQKKGVLLIKQQEIKRDPYAHRHFQSSDPLPLTDEQLHAYRQINKAVDNREHRTFLLHGVTGSGKTEIYLQTIARVLDEGKEAIVLVPEISLTPQMVSRFKARFGDQVAVLHSQLSSGERYDEWQSIQQGEVKVVIGARSALFAPFQNIGLIIIDEEHESSYKQEETPRYHARDVALFRGEYHRAPVVLGSATPTLESYARAQKKVYELLPLTQRVYGQSLPPVQIVDMRRELQIGNRSMFSSVLYEKMTERLRRKEQMVLLLNRRGFSTFVMCRDCGYVLQCPHCDISLTYHKYNRNHRCHYCGYARAEVQTCPECDSEHIRFFGTGTQRVEEELHKHFPGIRVIRMDVDTTRRKGAHEKYLRAFGEKKADCLLGTQMIAKGLDFENVTLVGVLAADALLHLPDFRAAERTFQLLTQVSGRAGRHDLPGEVVVQSYTPDHFSIQYASRHDFEGFYKHEMTYRHRHGYPPYFYITLIHFQHEDLPYLVKQAEKSVTWLKQNVSGQTLVFGPVASPLPKIKDRYRYHCMIKYRDEPHLNTTLQQLSEHLQDSIEKDGLQMHIDVQPQMFM